MHNYNHVSMRLTCYYVSGTNGKIQHVKEGKDRRELRMNYRVSPTALDFLFIGCPGISIPMVAISEPCMA